MTGQQVGYIRVSSAQQNTDRQLADIKLDKIFEDKVSAKDTCRPQLQACLNHLREGDTLHVHSIDRLARNLFDLQQIVTDLAGKGVCIHFHKENMTFSGAANPMQELMLQMLGAFAQFERALIKERQKEGIEQALKKGVKFGARPKLKPGQVEELKARVAAGEEKSRLAKEFGISRPTLYKLIAL
ncbi:recombinase family protein [Methylovulum psychrotolerans]|uniref:recombinase family protein n=1 Tax=Methylovulum psychrotolerans TaxID=1704499 RepID=UPI001BFF688F|nr:recombinase family protein [Methylovulum psychrotolerans]MBT9100502.1 recombinase family protein [Methylovulum psychrotolerans]